MRTLLHNLFVCAAVRETLAPGIQVSRLKRFSRIRPNPPEPKKHSPTGSHRRSTIVSVKLYVPRMLTTTERETWSTATKYVCVSKESLMVISFTSSGSMRVRLLTHHFRTSSALFFFYRGRRSKSQPGCHIVACHHHHHHCGSHGHACEKAREKAETARGKDGTFCAGK